MGSVLFECAGFGYSRLSLIGAAEILTEAGDARTSRVRARPITVRILSTLPGKLVLESNGSNNGDSSEEPLLHSEVSQPALAHHEA